MRKPSSQIFIFRADDDEGEEYIKGAELLTEFQRAKFKHFFYHVLDLNSDHVISQVSFSLLKMGSSLFLGSTTSDEGYFNIFSILNSSKDSSHWLYSHKTDLIKEVSNHLKKQILGHNRSHNRKTLNISNPGMTNLRLVFVMFMFFMSNVCYILCVLCLGFVVFRVCYICSMSVLGLL